MDEQKVHKETTLKWEVKKCGREMLFVFVELQVGTSCGKQDQIVEFTST